jgi:DNA-binding NtrC family response regulator
MPANLLLVEDNPLARRNLATFLEHAEHNVHQAETGEAALELIARTRFDVVISDLRLPGRVTGLDVLKYQNQISPETRLILITAFSSAEAQAEAESVGALYIEKPLSLTDLLAKI